MSKLNMHVQTGKSVKMITPILLTHSFKKHEGGENLLGKCELILNIINYTSLSCSSVQVQAKQHQFTSERGLKHVELVVFPNSIFKQSDYVDAVINKQPCFCAFFCCLIAAFSRNAKLSRLLCSQY